MRVRIIREDDAEAFLRLGSQLDRETEFMLLEPDERTTTVEAQRRQIAELLVADNSTILVAEDDGRLIGYLAARGGRARRARYSAHLVVGILREFTRQGIGTGLFEAVERWAREAGLHRLELTVMAHNRAGLALYTKMGFRVEGTRREALMVRGAWVDEYYMGKLLA
jgi:RimJ/RimL family protein N-acetyltransferase